MSKLKTKSALSYFGSDSEVAEKLAAMLDRCTHATIPFCGGLAILPWLKARSIVANDANEAVINFYRVMTSPRQDQLITMCEQTLSHPSESTLARQILAVNPHDPVIRAWAYWALCWICRKGKGGTKHLGGMPSVRRTANGGSNASRLAAAAADLTNWAEQFKRCEFECVDFRDLIWKVADHESCGVYCDPPWVELGRDYLHTFTHEDHHALRGLLVRFQKTKVVLRYGDHAFVRELYAHPRWTIIEAESRTQSNSVKGELWITNHGGWA